MKPSEIYQQLVSGYEKKRARLSRLDDNLSLARLLVFLTAGFFFYQGYRTDGTLYSLAGLAMMMLFMAVLAYHRKTRKERRLKKELIQINRDELAFLAGDKSLFDDGKAYQVEDHPFAHDLDFFGPNSMFQYLNRTGTIYGEESLAKTLLNIQSKAEIEATQLAVQELSGAVEWRQDLLANARLHPDSNQSKDHLKEWAERKGIELSGFVKLYAVLGPLMTLTSVLLYYLTPMAMFGQISLLMILVNLGMLAAHARFIRTELVPTTEIEKILKQYSVLLESIENANFNSDKLINLQSKLSLQSVKSSQAIKQLGNLFGQLEHVTNAFASPLLNGLGLFHLHVLRKLGVWRSRYSEDISSWLNVIGEIETLNSLANFSFNNPEYAFPELNDQQALNFEDLGHPLIDRNAAVTNSVSFVDHSFIILTGSNMSGKSTFLRTLGVNMVLAGIGAPVFAKNANIHPMPVLVSMRLSDSLADSESYFYAEVKRLKYIMNHLEQQACFVLLDEILRGTNSDDKRQGTIEVIRKIAGKKVFGGIATHDLEVCNVANEFRDALINKRFEVEIENDELRFDYRLLDGVCKNKSASFIMKKEGVI